MKRRTFIKSIAYAGAALPLVTPNLARALAANSKLNIGCIGVGGKGESDSGEVSKGGDNIVAICDVDSGTLAKAAGRFAQAAKYGDWRKLIEHKGLDAVTVSVPDHTHAPAAISAMRLGKHVYCQKPLAHSVYEARQMALTAEKMKVVTQMGIQHKSGVRFRMVNQLVRDGVIGKVKEAHAWTDRPGNWWRQGIDAPKGEDPVPATLNWEVWIGVAPMRAFKAGYYHPFSWRGFWDFGTGTAGDMGCHGMDPIISTLEIGPPLVIEAQGPPVNPQTGPLSQVIRYDFAATPRTVGPIRITWYDGGKTPPRELIKMPAEWGMTGNGMLLIGEKGDMFFNYDEGPFILPQEKFRDYPRPKLEGRDHYMQWVNACKGEGQTVAPFSYAGPLTETLLLGNIAYRSGKRVEWDSAAFQIKNSPEAAALLRREYRKGWGIEGLG